MRSTTRSKAPLRLLEELNRAPDISDLANRILQCVEDRIALKPALLVPGNPAHVENPHGLPMELLTESQTRPDPMQPISLPDGSVIYLFPLIHAGSLAANLYLYASGGNSQDLPLHQLKALNPICEVAAQAIAQRRAATIIGEGGVAPLSAGGRKSEIIDIPASPMTPRLLGTIAHDLRTPITVVRGYLKLMLSERIGPVTQDQKDCLEGAINSMNQLSRLAGLIGGASVLAEEIFPEILNFQDDLWRKTWNEVLLQAGAKSVSLREELPVERLSVWGDRRMLCDVVEKVIVSSIGFAERNTEMVVNLFSRKSGDVVLKITFNCGSMEPTGEDVVSGLQAIVFLNGGKLTFGTEIDNRSSFTLTLPGKDA